MTAAASRGALSALLRAEEARFVAAHPTSARLAAEASASLLGGVPMTWMAKWPGPFPVFLEGARGARLEDVDGHAYVDLCLGDTGAMAGHSPRPVADAVTDRLTTRGGATTMLPTEDAARVAGCCRPLRPADVAASPSRPPTPTAGSCASPATSRAGAGSSCSTGATTARSTRPSPCCATARVVAPGSNVGAPVDVATTTQVVAFNDLDAVERDARPRRRRLRAHASRR